MLATYQIYDNDMISLRKEDGNKEDCRHFPFMLMTDMTMIFINKCFKPLKTKISMQ